MKHILSICILSLLLPSCFEGYPGDIYFSVTQDGTVTYYNDNNYCLPYGFYYGNYYGPCTEGTYSFEYGLYTGSYWYGTYYIYENPGTSGFLYAEDGTDNYFNLHCTYGGSVIYGREGQPLQGKTHKGENEMQITEYLLPGYTVVIEQAKRESTAAIQKTDKKNI